MANTEITRVTEGDYKPQDTYDEWHRDSMKVKTRMRQTYRVTRDMCYKCGVVNPSVIKRVGIRTYCGECYEGS